MSNKCKVSSTSCLLSSHYLIISLFNLPNIPCTFVKVQEEEASGNLILDCERYVKHTNVTYITSGTSLFKTCAEEKSSLLERFKLSETGINFRLITK